MAKPLHFSSFVSLSELSRTTTPPPRFVLFLGIDKETSSPWCPDVRRCAPAIRKACSEAEASLVEVDVGERSEWKPPATHPFRSPPLSLKGIPTLLAVDGEGKELGRIGPELEATSSEEEARGVAGAFVSKKGGGGGGGGGGKQKRKGPSTLIPKEKPPYASVDVVMLTLLLVESYRRAMGKPLIGRGGGTVTTEGGQGEEEELEISDAPRALYEFPFAVLAHDRFSVPEGQEPRFTYANAAAQRVFEAPWGDIVGMESRKSADATDEAVQLDRANLLNRAAETGQAQTNYKGWRVSLKGTKFEIQDGVLFNVKSPSGENVGQAVVFGHWKYEDGTEGGPGAGSAASSSAPPSSPSSPSSTTAAPPASAADVEAAEAAVAAQAAAVRALKDSGKGNSDPEVASAVEELLRLKGVVAGLKGE